MNANVKVGLGKAATSTEDNSDCNMKKHFEHHFKTIYNLCL